MLVSVCGQPGSPHAAAFFFSMLFLFCVRAELARGELVKDPLGNGEHSSLGRVLCIHLFSRSLGLFLGSGLAHGVWEMPSAF